jgi:tripartite-type tricarboxylate transporter receptor subunit TctC
MQTTFSRCVLLVLLAAAAAPALAQSYPTKPIRLIVEFAPGGLIDTMARAIQPKVSEALGQPVIIENRGGAGGTLAEAQVAKSPPDGYTVLFAGDAVAFNPHLFNGLPYDLFRDLVPVSQIAKVPLVMIVPANLPVGSAQEFAAYARARPGQLSYASPGSGVSMFAAEIFKELARIDLSSVPYKGGGPALIDVMSGQVHTLFTSVFLVAPQVKSGKLKALAVASERRSPLLPETPTFAEAGFSDFIAGSWSGLLAPAGTPQAVIQRLHADFAKALRSPEVEARFRELGTEVIGSSPAEFSALLKKEHEIYGRLIRELKITVN